MQYLKDKSQLAIEYAYRVFEQSPETWVFWIHASNVSRFKQGFQEIAELVKIPGREDVQANIFQLVHNWLLNGSKSKWLVILDNVDDAHFLVDTSSPGEAGQMRSTGSRSTRPLQAYIPHCDHGSVVITSRTKTAALKLVDEHAIFTVEPMGRADALMLCKKKLGRYIDDDEDSDDNVTALVEALEYMPLAIVQASALISRRAPRYSIRQYLEDFQESDSQRTRLLEYRSEILRRDPQANNSIIATWQISFDHIRAVRPSAADLLSFMCFFDRQGIPEDLLHYRAEQRGSQRNPSPNVQAQQRLSREEPETRANQKDSRESQKAPRKARTTGLSLKSLFHRKSGSGAHLKDQNGVIDSSQDRKESNNHCPNATSTISHHNGDGDDGFEEDILVLRDYSFISANNDQKTFEMHRLVQLATRKWLETQNQEEKWKERFIKNLESGLPRSDDYKNWPRWQLLFPHAQSAAVQRPLHRDALLDWASVLHETAWYAYEVGNYREAEKLAIKVLHVRKTFLGRQHDKTLGTMLLLSGVYHQNYRFDAAEELRLQIWETTEQLYGADNYKTLVAAYDTAITYRMQGSLDAAERLLIKVKNKLTENNGTDHPLMFDCLHCLAYIYMSRGWLEKAEQLSVQVLNARKKQRGTDHVKTIDAMSRLGVIYRKQKRYNAAEEILVRVLAARKKLPGAQDVDIIGAMHDLARLWVDIDRVPKATALMEECIQLTTRILGPEHPDTLLSSSLLAPWKAKKERADRRRLRRAEKEASRTMERSIGKEQRRQDPATGGRYLEARETARMSIEHTETQKQEKRRPTTRRVQDERRRRGREQT
ncbi:hypothetical protein CJF32_00005098 [Rutstroemia sp. NJR-2017a WRK4]|nr:hypothetical protein CJF32_00005098 [Rutstroemia sp. NJR-2017a WRK4]